MRSNPLEGVSSKPQREQGRMESCPDMAKEVLQKLHLISQRASSDPSVKFNNLMHLINEGSLEMSFLQWLGRNRAEGIDGVSWEEYGRERVANIKDLLERMRRMGYRPKPARRVYIPKDKNSRRPLGLPSIEDKMVQKVMSRIMESIYEAYYLDCSYGFRRRTGCHDALRRVGELINFKPINHVIEADIKGFFDNVPHDKLIELIRKRITDERFIRYIQRFLKAGYKEDDVFYETKKGTPQGGNLSPLLANVFLHYVLDEWFEKEVKPFMKGQCNLVRYCDDLVILVQYKTDAEEIMVRMQQRFQAYGLELHPEKTNVKSFGRYEKENAKKQKRRLNTFDFLGFTHYCGVSRKGKFKICRKTTSKKFRQACRKMKEWLKKVRDIKVQFWWQTLASKLRGHYQYYGVSENSRSIQGFYYRVIWMVFKWMNRRSHKKSFNMVQYNAYLKTYPLPRPRIVHSFYKVAR